MLDRQLCNGPHYLIEAAFLGLGHMTVVNKRDGRTVRASRQQRNFLIDALRFMDAVGIAPDSTPGQAAIESWARAVTQERADQPRWQALFDLGPTAWVTRHVRGDTGGAVTRWF